MHDTFALFFSYSVISYRLGQFSVHYFRNNVFYHPSCRMIKRFVWLFSFQCASLSVSTLKTKQRRKLCEVPLLLRKEVIQPHLPIRLPCYDFTPIIYPTLGGWLLTVTSPTSGVTNSRGVTGGVYKARERIHRGVLIRDY